MVLWRRVPYFGDAISHASILGIVLGLYFNLNIAVAIIITSLCFGFLLVRLRQMRVQDVLTVIFSYSFLSLGMLLTAILLRNSNVDIFSYLFGDILLVNLNEVILGLAIAFIVLVWVLVRWQSLVFMSINEDLATVEGVNTKGIETEFVIIMALVIGISIKIVGVLLVASILVIPAAAARNISTHPLQMVSISVLIGALSAFIGIGASYFLDTVTGPAIVVSSAVLFVLSLVLKKLVFSLT